MATGRNTKLTGQVGEHLVAAELSRRGLIAADCTGAAPHYDIIAADESGRNIPIQVRSSRGGAWQLDEITQFCEITFEGKRQIIGELKKAPVRRLILIFVTVDEYGKDRFYILAWERLRDLVVKGHKELLETNNGIRPKRWDALNASMSERKLRPYQDKWVTIKKDLR